MPPAALGATPTTSTSDRFTCATKGLSRTLVRTVEARIYAVAAGGRNDYQRTKVYACSTRTGRSFYINLGNTVAWVISVINPATGTATNRIRQISLGSGRLVRSVNVGSAFVRPLLAPNSYLAWIDQAPDGTCTPTCSVHVFNRQGDRVIDSGADIEPDSLARDPGDAVGASTTVGSVTRILWIKSATARTALYSG